MDRRKSSRKALDPIHVSDIKSVNPLIPLARYGTILNASATGLLIRVKHRDLSHQILKYGLPFATIEGENVVMKIIEMELEIDGKIVEFRQAGQAVFEIAVDFTENAPTYWRECLADLLPGFGEIGPTESFRL